LINYSPSFIHHNKNVTEFKLANGDVAFKNVIDKNTENFHSRFEESKAYLPKLGMMTEQTRSRTFFECNL